MFEFGLRWFVIGLNGVGKMIFFCLFVGEFFFVFGMFVCRDGLWIVFFW